VCVAANAAAYICDGTGSSNDIAAQTASAYASAVASVVANCVLVGDSSAKVHAVAEAKAQAEIWVSSYFEAVANAANCETCEAWAYSWGYISKWVFLEAIAKAEVKVCNVSYPMNQLFWHKTSRLPYCFANINPVVLARL
jgi:hypothetical protein